MTDREIFTRNFRKFLSQSGYQQQDIAKAVGVSRQTVSTWVTGKNYPRADVMERLASFFGIRLSDLVCDEEGSMHEAQLLYAFNSMSEEGKAKLLERAEELLILYGSKKA